MRRAEEISKDFVGQSNFIKMKLNGQEIDFIVASNLIGLKPQKNKHKRSSRRPA
jgi:hypothetical protein